jgi:hypothetical protein
MWRFRVFSASWVVVFAYWAVLGVSIAQPAAPG